MDTPSSLVFSNLPTELRQLIWSFTLPESRKIYRPRPRGLSPYKKSFIKLLANFQAVKEPQGPIALEINHESRLVALQHYEWVEELHCYFDFSKDSIFYRDLKRGWSKVTRIFSMLPPMASDEDDTDERETLTFYTFDAAIHMMFTTYIDWQTYPRLREISFLMPYPFEQMRFSKSSAAEKDEELEKDFRQTWKLRFENESSTREYLASRPSASGYQIDSWEIMRQMESTPGFVIKEAETGLDGTETNRFLEITIYRREHLLPPIGSSNLKFS
jgi:hypothetical protein